MLDVPEVTDLDVAFGNIKHMPKYDDVPEEFKNNNGNVYCKAISTWFFKGARIADGGLIVEDVVFAPKEGVDGSKAIAAIRAILGSYEPKHEHKEAGCAFMLSEWFLIEKEGTP